MSTWETYSCLIPKAPRSTDKVSLSSLSTLMFGVLLGAESTLGFQYFFSFIDDYSRCTWLFLMKTGTELFSIFQKFHAKV